MKKTPLGADLVIPLLALAFAIYFFISIADLAWEAKANGVVVGTVLVVLVAVQLARIGVRLVRAEGDLRADPLWKPWDVLLKRVGMVLISVAFIVSLPWLGLTLAVWLAMIASLLVMGIRRRSTLLWLPVGIAAVVYVMFIAILESDFPRGPIERLLAALLS